MTTAPDPAQSPVEQLSSVPKLSASQIKNWHRTVVLLFVFMGAPWAAVITRMPLVKVDLGVTASQLGLILLAGGLGSLVGLNLVGRMIARFGTKIWIRIFFPLLGAATAINTVLIENHLTIVYLVSGILVGSLMGITDVAVNVDGTALEKETGKNLMPRMHAGFSVGTLIGSGWGSVASALNLSLFWTAAPLSAISIALPFVVAKYLPEGTGIETKHASEEKKPAGHWFTFNLVFFGIGILAVSLAEGGAGDWMTLGFSEGYKASGPEAGIGFTLFFMGMVLLRYFGGNLADKIGKGRALQLVAGIGVIGIVMVILGHPNLIVGWIGAVLWGIGVALGFPLFLSVAGEGENSAKRVGFVATWGYGAFLAGPPVLGLIADHTGMLNMYWMMAGFMFIALLVAGAAQAKKS